MFYKLHIFSYLFVFQGLPSTTCHFKSDTNRKRSEMEIFVETNLRRFGSSVANKGN